MTDSLLAMRAEVDEKFQITTDRNLMHPGMIRYVEAVAGTGTRYTVVVTQLPEGAAGPYAGPVLVTVLHPWTAAKIMADTGYLDPSYVREHLTPRAGAADVDMYALTLTVRHALGRTEV